MKILCDFHHSGAAQGQALLFHRRLGHDLYFPDADFVSNTQSLYREGDVMPCLPWWLRKMGGYPEYRNKDWEYVVNYEQALTMDWDVFLVTRVETQNLFSGLRVLHPKGDKIKLVAMTGNDNSPFDWNLIENLMSSDYPTYVNAPSHVHKIWYSQEIGHHYFDQPFIPVEGLGQYTINQFCNCWPSMRGPWDRAYDMSNWPNGCPHCGADQSSRPLNPTIDPYGIWLKAAELLPARWFEEYGINCKHGCVDEVNLPSAYVKGAVTVHFKTYDGYGYSMLQSIVCGRPVIVPKGFHTFRTAGKYLIPNLTCFEADWSGESLAETITEVTSDLKMLNHYAKSCYVAARGLFDFELEAHRVQKFLEDLK